MPNLKLNQENSARSCSCGARTFTATAWNVMTEAQRASAEAQPCLTCAHDKAQR